MKMLFIAVLLMFSSVAMATDSALTVSVESETLYRGQSLSNGAVGFGANLEVTDVVVDGVFMTLNFNSWSLSPVRDITVRRDFGVGYAGSLGAFDYSASLNRVWNPVFHATDYTEARVSANMNLTDNIVWLTRIGQIVGGNLSKDTYVATGLGFSVQNISIEALVSGMRYEVLSNMRYNNAEITGRVNIFTDWTLYGTLSHGGTGLNNQRMIGISRTF